MNNSLVPAPQANQQNFFLSSTGWKENNDTDYFLSSQGIWLKGNETNLFLKGNATYGKMTFPKAQITLATNVNPESINRHTTSILVTWKLIITNNSSISAKDVKARAILDEQYAEWKVSGSAVMTQGTATWLTDQGIGESSVNRGCFLDANIGTIMPNASVTISLGSYRRGMGNGGGSMGNYGNTMKYFVSGNNFETVEAIQYIVLTGNTVW